MNISTEEVNTIIITNKFIMRENSLKKVPLAERSYKIQSGKYPTYQHYYQPKVTQLKQLNSSRKSSTYSEEKSPTEPSDYLRKANRNNLKFELEHLKKEVHKIIEKKSSLGQLPTYKKFGQVPMVTSPDNKRADINDDNLSVTSEKVINQPLKRLYSLKNIQAHDPVKYMQLQNNILKTELKNLKDKYQQKKRQLTEKCEALEQKTAYLQNSLFECEKNFQVELSSLREALVDMGMDREAATSSRSQMSDQADDEARNLREKINKLYEQLSKKNNAILDLQEKLERALDQALPNINQIEFEQERNKILIDENNQIKLQNNELRNILQNNEAIIRDLQQDTQGHSQNDYAYLHQQIASMKAYYEPKLRELSENIKFESESKLKIQQQKYLIEEELRFLKKEDLQNKSKIQQLKNRSQQESNKINELQGRIRVISDQNRQIQKRYNQKVADLQADYQSKILSITTLQDNQNSRSLSPSNSSSLLRDNQMNPEVHGHDLEKQIMKWKAEYINIREKYDTFVRNNSNKQVEIKQYFRFYREEKQNGNILNNKFKLIEREHEKLLIILSQKEKDLLSKTTELSNLSSLYNVQSKQNSETIKELTQRCKNLEEKLAEQISNSQKNSTYKFQMEQILLKEQKFDNILKELTQRLKKRLLEQQQKSNKLIKEQKNKEIQINKLKQQLRQNIQNSQKKYQESKSKELKRLTEEYLNAQFESTKITENTSRDKVIILEDANNKLMQQIQAFKNQIINKDLQIEGMFNEMDMFAHSYNLKCIEFTDYKEQANTIIKGLENKIQQAIQSNKIAMNLVKRQIQYRDSEISYLKENTLQMNTKANINQPLKSGQFQQVLKNQMEENKKMREEATKKMEENFRLRDSYMAVRSQNDSLKSEMQILKLRALSEKKNVEVAFQVQIQNLKNTIDGRDKKINSLDQKIKNLFQEIKKKDSFIQNFIIGKKISQSQKQIVTSFLAKYELAMQPHNIVEKLNEELNKIEEITRYNKELTCEVAHLRDRIVYLEALNNGQHSLYASKMEKMSTINGGSDYGSDNEISSLRKVASNQSLSQLPLNV